jgi:NitT/TauT family transport system substrate-binding protein
MRFVVAIVLLGLVGATGCASPTSAPPAKTSAAPAAGGSSAGSPAATAVPAAANPTAAAPSAPAAAPLERQTVKYGYNPILSGAPIYVAQERGYFAEQGFEVEYTPFDSAALMVAPVSAGQLDMMPAVPGPGTFNALARGVNMQAIAAQSWSYTGLLVRKELYESGQVRTIPDLKGRRVSFNIEGSPVDYSLRNVYQMNSLTLDDVEVQRVTNTDLAAALSNSAVDAGVVPEPLSTNIESRGIGVRLVDVQEMVGRQTGSMVTVGPSMLGRGDAVIARFLVAYLKGVREYMAGIKDNHITDPAILEIVNKWTRIPPETISAAVTLGMDPNGRIDREDINRQQEFWYREGLVPVRADLNRFIEYKYLDAALAQLR